MFDAKSSLLPPTATPVAKALDILEERLFNLPVQMISKDPATVDVRLLDHLAWELSAEVWDMGWPEEVKRNVIAVSAEVHKYKGTPYAIKTAMSVFGVDVELVEWWQEGGSGIPGTFLVRTYVAEDDGVGLDTSDPAAVVSAMQSVLRRAAPVSRGWALQFGASRNSQSFCGAFSTVHLLANAPAEISPPPILSASAGLMAVATVKLVANSGA